MCRSILIQTLYSDLPTFKRQKLHGTYAALSYLHSQLRYAAVFNCGQEQEILARYPDRAKLFVPQEEDQPAQILTLANPNTLLVYTKDAGVKIAAFLTDERQMGLEMYIFRFEPAKNRWIWPLIGMLYGPPEDSIKQIAVYEPKILSGLPPQSQKAMVQDHAKELPIITQALRWVLTEKPEPLEGKFSIVRKTKIVQAAPRTKHKHKGQVSGSHSG